jgi:hypothetical protein
MDAEQFAQFLAGFNAAVTNSITAAVQQAQGQQGQNNPAPHTPKIFVKFPTYKGDPSENVLAWLLQVRTIFRAQGINDGAIRIYYAATGLQGSALHWYLNKVQTTLPNQQTFTGWDDFMAQLRAAFEPPNYQQHLRRQLKQLKQTGSVHEYGAHFRNLIGQITDMADLDKVTYFIEGLKPATKMEVNYQSPANFEDAWKLAIRYDTAMFGLGKPTTKGSSSSSPSSSSFSSQQRRFPPRNNNNNNNHH